jgi:hypothetical protein
MSNPQQPELRRSGHSPVGQDHAAEVAGGRPGTRERRRAGPRPVPPHSEPGHHPEREQDKPADPAHPLAAAGTESGAGVQRFPFEFDGRLVPLELAFGVVPSTAYVDVGEGGLCIRFREPVPAALPASALRQPAATVTVASPTALSEALA